MNIQSETVRHYVLDNLESGNFKDGMRLPGSRKISEMLNISRPVVQNALDTLVNEGILQSVSRSGLYVDEQWKNRRIRNSLRVYTFDDFLPWMPLFREEMAKLAPELHISDQCSEGDFEIITTATAQTRHKEFADLSPLLKSCYPDLSPFYTEQLKPFILWKHYTARKRNPPGKLCFLCLNCNNSSCSAATMSKQLEIFYISILPTIFKSGIDIELNLWYN